MSLADIKNILYKREENTDLPAPLTLSKKSGADGKDSEASPKISTAWGKTPQGWWSRNQMLVRRIALYIGAVFVFGLLVGAVFWYRSASFSLDRVNITFNDLGRITSGQKFEVKINIFNNNRAKLNSAILKITYPENFYPVFENGWQKESATSSILELKSLDSFSQNEMTFVGQAFYPRGALIYLNAELNFVSSIASSDFVAGEKIGINVLETPITLTLLAPQTVATGNAVDYVIEYQNTGSEIINDAQIKLEYPNGFYFKNSQPVASENNNLWFLGKVASGAGGKIVVSGTMSGDQDSTKVMHAYLGTTDNGQWISFDEERTETKISALPITLTQKVNGVQGETVDAGEALNFEINYRNTDSLAYRNAILTAVIDSPVLDYATLEASGGHFDNLSKTITWKASNLKELANIQPNDQGSVKFKIKIKNIIPVLDEADKNFVIVSLAKIDSLDINSAIASNKVIASNEVSVKLNSKLILDAKGYFQDALIENSGPLPPVVDQDTTYTIHWSASNVSNDVINAKVEANLPNGVSFTGLKNPDSADISFDQRTNRLVWTIGKIAAGTGINKPKKEVAFQIKIRPSLTQNGREADLLDISTFSAHDVFTDKDLSVTFEKKTTHLTEDSATKNKSEVVAGS